VKKLVAGLAMSLVMVWTATACAHGIWSEEIWTWIVRWFVMQAGGQWN